MTYQYLDIAAAVDTRPPMPPQILPGLIPGVVGSIVAPGATGKSTLALQLAAYVATGHDFFGFGSRGCGRVIIFAAEDPAPILGARIHDIAQKLTGDEREYLGHFLKIVQITPGDPRDLLDGGRTTDAMCRASEGFELVIIDTKSRFHTGDENARSDAARVMREQEKIAAGGAAVVALAHTSKSAGLNGLGDAQQASRGSGVWVDEARWVAFMQTMTADEAGKHGVSDEFRKSYVRYGLSKANYIAPQPDIWLRRDYGGVFMPHEMQQAQKQTAEKGDSDARDDWY